jgi:gamma-glutamylcyclotransferase (GGCT)/AIG2-like uncharacterized protein YtfP
MPGQPRWPALQPYAESWVEGTARGRLWDTGSGYPAARFDEGDARIPGVVVVLRSGRLGEVVRLLDAIEGEGVLFRRVTVVTSEGPALAYEWVRSTDGLEPLPGGWIDQTLGRDRGPGS